METAVWADHPIVAYVRATCPDSDTVGILERLSETLGCLEAQYPGMNFKDILAHGIERFEGFTKARPWTVDEYTAACRVLRGECSTYRAAADIDMPESSLRKLVNRLRADRAAA